MPQTNCWGEYSKKKTEKYKQKKSPQSLRREDHEETPLWALTDSNRRPSACKADALNQLS